MRDVLGVNPQWQYLMWRAHALAGEKDAADKMYRRLIGSTARDSYLQFRFLRRPHSEVTRETD